jgi:hypothetical protein
MIESYNEHVAVYGERNTTLDRTDNDGHYCKENCLWATRREQMENTSRTVNILHRGELRALKAWCRHYGLNYQSMTWRIKRMGLGFEEAARRAIDLSLSRLRERVVQCRQLTQPAYAPHANTISHQR